MENLKPIDIAKNITEYGFLESFDGGEHTFLEEEVNGKKEFFVTGQFLKKNFESRNKVFYTSQVVDNFVEQINREDSNIVMWVTHFPTNAMRETAAKVVEAWSDDDWGYYKARLLETTAGNDIKVLLKEGIVDSVSVRYFPVDWKEDKKTGVATLFEGNLKGIDYVSRAGVVGASARLTESDKQTLNTFLESVDNKLLEKGIREVFSMDNEKKENLEQSKDILALEAANNKIAELEEKNTNLISENKTLKESVEKVKDEVKELVETIIADAKKANIESISELTKVDSIKERIRNSIESIKFNPTEEQSLVEAYNNYSNSIVEEAKGWKELIESVKAEFEKPEVEEKKESVEDDDDGDRVTQESVKEIKKSIYENLDNDLIMRKF